MKIGMNCASDLMRPHRIVSVCNDPGGGAAILPVVRELVQRGNSVLSVVAGPSVSMFASELDRSSAVVSSDSIGVDEAAHMLRKLGAQTLLSAAGAYNTIEHAFRLAARRVGISSVAVLDYWYEYAARFQRTIDGTITTSKPDFVCALDEMSFIGLIEEAGFRPDQVMISGPPNLEATVRNLRNVTEEEAVSWREKYDIRADELTIVFFSDPFYVGPNGEYVVNEGTAFDEEGRSLFGYTPEQILWKVLSNVQGMADMLRQSTNVLVKPHPREQPERLRPLVNSVHGPWLRSDIIENGSGHELIGVADIVMGMGSIALLEAALAGKTAVSVEIGLRDVNTYDPCIGNVLGYTIPVFDEVALQQILGRIFHAPTDQLTSSPRQPLLIDGAAARVADIMEKYCKNCTS